MNCQKLKCNKTFRPRNYSYRNGIRNERYTSQYHKLDNWRTPDEMKTEMDLALVYLSQDEETSKSALELLSKGLTTTPGLSLSASNKKEIEDLIANNIFSFTPWNISVLAK